MYQKRLSAGVLRFEVFYFHFFTLTLLLEAFTMLGKRALKCRILGCFCCCYFYLFYWGGGGGAIVMSELNVCY